MTALIILTSIAAYLTIGWLLAKRDLPAQWANANANGSYGRTARVEVQDGFVFMWFGWPILWPMARLFSAVGRAVSRAVDQADPLTIAHERDTLARRVADLEAELRIEDTP